jgi:hypothetical protein
MAEILVAPIVIEYGLNGAHYESIVQDLREAGHRASLNQPEERRSAGAVAAQAAYLVAIYLLVRVGDRATDEVLDEITATVKRRLRRAVTYRDRRRKAVIYGARNEVLREFDMPEGASGGEEDSE